MLIVQKYGGTSVGSLDCIKNIANKVMNDTMRGKKLVLVLSAMSGTTDKLIEDAYFFSKTPHPRALDMLLATGENTSVSLLTIALAELKVKSIGISAREAKIITDCRHGNAKIQSIDGNYILEKVEDGFVVIISGFQGISTDGDITTLGRGGSDLSAVAVAGAVNAELCEIYSDVNGILTADPRIVPKAQQIERISYEEMLELSSLGAKVLQTRSVQLATKLNIRLVAKNTFNLDNPGTLIISEDEDMEKPDVRAIALDTSKARVTMRGIEDKPGVVASVFQKLERANINIDMIIQNIGYDFKANLSFTFFKKDLDYIKKIFINSSEFIIDELVIDEHIAQLSVVGLGMKDHSGIAAKAFASFAKENVNILMISTSEIKISVIVHEKYAELMYRELHNIYELDINEEN